MVLYRGGLFVNRRIFPLVAVGIGSTVLTGCGIASHLTATPRRHHRSGTVRTTSQAKPSRFTSSFPSSGTSPSSSSTESASSPTFPTIIQHAMHHISPGTTEPLWAPTSYPGAVHSPLPVTALGYVGQAGYQVVFQRNQRPIGHYAVHRYGSNGQAVQHLFSAMTAPPLPSVPAQGAAIALGHGITAHIEPMPAAKSYSIVWQEGRWAMAVEYSTGQQAVATRVAMQTVSYAHGHFLPAPSLEGWIIEQVGHSVSTTVAWGQKSLVFQTTSFGPWNSNLSGGWLSALEMAATMRPY